MTKIKNTKKGMAKKTLSMSLVVAMLATSNVPVWAAEFSDGTDATAFTSEVETQVVDETPDIEDEMADTATASVNTISIDDLAANTEIKAGSKVTVKTSYKTDDSHKYKLAYAINDDADKDIKIFSEIGRASCRERV